ncbi:MAG: peroxiredoxin family protein [Chloroflexia bacterium]
MVNDTSVVFYLSYAALWVLVILQSLILLGLVRMVYQLQRTGVVGSSSEGIGDLSLRPGQEAPEFSAVDLSGAPISSADFHGLKAILFVSPNCPSCTLTLYEMQALKYKASGNVLVVCRANRDECIRLAERHELDIPTVADEDERISRLFGVSSVPVAVLINDDGRIRSYGYPQRDELEKALGTTPEGDAQPQVQGVG